MRKSGAMRKTIRNTFQTPDLVDGVMGDVLGLDVGHELGEEFADRGRSWRRRRRRRHGNQRRAGFRRNGRSRQQRTAQSLDNGLRQLDRPEFGAAQPQLQVQSAADEFRQGRINGTQALAAGRGLARWIKLDPLDGATVVELSHRFSVP